MHTKTHKPLPPSMRDPEVGPARAAAAQEAHPRKARPPQSLDRAAFAAQGPEARAGRPVARSKGRPKV
jgi:hypothetical protein